MRTILIIMLLFVLSCARVSVEAPKDPIKIDITMRLDIYQHVIKDIDAIEDIVSGAQKDSNFEDNRSFFNIFLPTAFAQELDPEVEQAALRRRNRYDNLNLLRSKGVIGENRFGLAEIRDFSSAGFKVKTLVEAENTDRMIIYTAIAKKNNISVNDIQKLYATRLQSDAPAGTPIEVFNEISGRYEWRIK